MSRAGYRVLFLCEWQATVMLVKEFADHAGVAPHIVRYYARIGLLNPFRDPQNGYQQFGQADLVRIQFIRTARAVGFTLSAVGDLLRDEMRGAAEFAVPASIVKCNDTPIMSASTGR